MSETDQPIPSKEEVDQPNVESSSQEEQKFVPATAYKEVSSDMHKYKQRAKEAQAKANELEARMKAIEENELKAKQEYQTLYEREKAAKEALAQEKEAERGKYLRSVKLSALKSELGKVKDDYLSFADIDSIEMKEDGTLSSESVQAVANNFRQNYPELIAKDSSVNITGSAPGSGVPTPQGPKSLSEMTTAEKIAELNRRKNRS